MQRYSFLAWTLHGGEWFAARPGRCTPGKDPRYPLSRRLAGPQSWSGRYGKEKYLLAVPKFKPRINNSVASRGTDYSVPTPRCYPLVFILLFMFQY